MVIRRIRSGPIVIVVVRDDLACVTHARIYAYHTFMFQIDRDPTGTPSQWWREIANARNEAYAIIAQVTGTWSTTYESANAHHALDSCAMTELQKGSTMEPVSKHFTERAATLAANRRNTEPSGYKPGRRSSGHDHIDYTVTKASGLRRYHVTPRSV